MYGREDILTHFGIVSELLLNGNFDDQTNFYPLIHIFSASLSLILDIKIFSSFILIEIVYYILYIVSMYLLSNLIFSKKIEKIFLIISATLILPYGSISIGTKFGMFPTILANFFIPFIIYLLLKQEEIPINKKINFKILLLILLFFSIFFHPLGSIILAFFFIIIEVSKLVYSKFKIHRSSVSKSQNKVSFKHISILIITLLIWISSFPIFNIPLKNLFAFLLNQVNNGQGASLVTNMDKLRLSDIDIISLGLKTFGDQIIYYILSILAIIYILKNVKYYEGFINLRLLIILISFIFFSLFFLLILKMDLGFSGFRFLAPISICSTILGSITLSILYQKKNLHLIIIFIIVISSMIGFFHTYPSPLIFRPNEQVTYMEMRGFLWLLDNKDKSILFTPTIATSAYRFVDMLKGPKERVNRDDIIYNLRSKLIIPGHFNYTTNTKLKDSIPESFYLAVTEIDKILYSKIWQNVGRFDESDFEKLYWDKSLNHIYTNKGFNVWRSREIL